MLTGSCRHTRAHAHHLHTHADASAHAHANADGYARCSYIIQNSCKLSQIAPNYSKCPGIVRNGQECFQWVGIIPLGSE